MQDKWYVYFILVLLILGIIFSIAWYIKDKSTYNNNRITIRKVYYGAVVIVIASLWVTGVINIAGFKLEQILMTMGAIFAIDLFIIQTPEITKIWNNELKHEHLEKAIDENQETYIDLSRKLIWVNDFIPKNNESWKVEEDFDYTGEKYKKLVEGYLNNFAKEFDLLINVHYIQVPNSKDENEFEFNVNKVYSDARKEHDFTVKNTGVQLKEGLELLMSGNNIEKVDGKKTAVLFPFFGEFHNLLIVVSSKKGSKATGADASLLLTLMYSLDYWLVTNEHQFDTFE